MSKRKNSTGDECEAKHQKGLGPLADPNWIFTGTGPIITNPIGSMELLYRHMSRKEQKIFKEYVDKEFEKINSIQEEQLVLAIQVAHKIVNGEKLIYPPDTRFYNDIRMLFG